MSPTTKKYFTVEQANQRLPLVEKIVSDIVALFNDIEDRRIRLKRIQEIRGADPSESTMHGQELVQMERDIETDIEKLRDYIEELQDLGVELKNPNVGVIDFLTLVDGREAYLCWKLGEEELAWWHELEGCFQGRQSLLEASTPSFSDGSELDTDE